MSGSGNMELNILYPGSSGDNIGLGWCSLEGRGKRQRYYDQRLGSDAAMAL